MSGEYHKPDMVIVDDPALRNLDREGGSTMSDQDECGAMAAATDPPAVLWPFRRPPTMLDSEAPHVSVYLVVNEPMVICATTDRNLAHKLAGNVGGVVARLPVVGDYRKQASDTGTVAS